MDTARQLRRLSAATLVAWVWLVAGGLAWGETVRSQLAYVDGEVAVVELGVAKSGASLRIAALPLDSQRRVDLILEPLRVVSPDARIVIGQVDGADRRFDFDPASVRMFRGRVAGRPASRVLLALGRHHRMGFVDLGGEAGRWQITGVDRHGKVLEDDRVAVFPARPLGAANLPVAECGVELPAGRVRHPISRGKAGLPNFEPPDLRFMDVAAATKQIQLAVDTDFEFFELFGDLSRAAEYVVMLYAAVSEIYFHDLNAYVELSFLRLWDTPDDLFNDVDPTPLPAVRDYWETQMPDVERDAVQLISGRRDYPFGGQAFLAGLCTPNQVSVVGYMLGFFPDPGRPSPYTYDVAITAHELGHTCGSRHTHDSPNFLDTCNNPTTRAQRGTIMSYCGQTWSGQNANRDLYFHTGMRGAMRAHIEESACVVNDCDLDGVDDAVEVDGDDANANGVPDRCEDCNRNGLRDDREIEQGLAFDADGNGVPDVCQTDCDGNELPDVLDILDGRDFDLHGNGVLDMCEVDYDLDGQSDYNQIQEAMFIDIDRNLRLDVCEDCSGDGTLDQAQLVGAHNIWIGSGIPGNPLREFHATSGVLANQSDQLVPAVLDVIAAPTGEIWASTQNGRVVAFSRNGQYVRDVIPGDAAEVPSAAGLLMLRDTLLVANRELNAVLAYSLDGALLGPFVQPGAGGLFQPFSMTISRRGTLLVTSNPGAVLEYNANTGAFLGTFVQSQNNSGLLEPRGMTFKADGNLLVASFGTNEVLEFDGLTGQPLGPWAKVGTATVLTRISPWGVRVGPNGNVFVSRTGEEFGSSHPDHDDADAHHAHDEERPPLHLTNAQVYEFDVSNGNFVRTYVGGFDHGLQFATGFDFVPGWNVDCNFNLLPDSCDVSDGTSTDDNLSQIPDECEVDCNGNGRLDRLDLLPFGAALDCNFNLLPDTCDVEAGFAEDCNLNLVPDECESLEVTRVVFERESGADGFEIMRWVGRGPGVCYDVAGGPLEALRGDGGVRAAGCLANDLSQPVWSSAFEPATGGGFYVIVRSQTDCGNGSYGQDSAGVERQPVNACP